MKATSPEVGTERPAHVLVIDDDEELCELMSLRLTAHGYRSSLAHDGRTALALLERDPADVVILDLRLGPEDGSKLLGRLLERAPSLQVLVLTAHGSIETAVAAMRQGAMGFMTKPFRDHELLDNLTRALDARARAAYVGRAPAGANGDAMLIGSNAAMSELHTLMQRVGPSDATVLITGESGTGKELVARALHELSPRHKGPFVPLNCGALPSALLTSELFGHTKGAFTGATHDREGVFGAARGGTLFLDEIGEASLDVQVRLLRVLQERRYTPVGSSTEKLADVRIVAATHRDLRAEVAEKRFREDLYYRLHVVPLMLPPLRDRKEDIPQLVEVFLARTAAKHGRRVPRLEQAALNLLCTYAWPGNVRQLNHVVEAGVLLAQGPVIDADLLAKLISAEAPGAPAEGGDEPRKPATEEADVSSHPSALSAWFEGQALPPFAQVRREFERMYLIEVLRRARGNVTLAARMAGRHRTDFYELLNRHNLTGSAFRPT
jgi:two-component system response regulator GlrR